MKLVKLLSLVIAFLFATSIVLSNHSLDDSQKTADLHQDVTALEHDLTLKRSELAESSSLTSLSAKIKEAGFTDTPSIVYLRKESGLASR